MPEALGLLASLQHRRVPGWGSAGFVPRAGECLKLGRTEYWCKRKMVLGGGGGQVMLWFCLGGMHREDVAKWGHLTLD